MSPKWGVTGKELTASAREPLELSQASKPAAGTPQFFLNWYSCHFCLIMLQPQTCLRRSSCLSEQVGSGEELQQNCSAGHHGGWMHQQRDCQVMSCSEKLPVKSVNCGTGDGKHEQPACTRVTPGCQVTAVEAADIFLCHAGCRRCAALCCCPARQAASRSDDLIYRAALCP